MNRRLLTLICLCTCLLLISGIASAGPTKTTDAASIDNLVDALKINANTTYFAVNASAATIEQNESPPLNCGLGGQPSVWFKYKADRAVSLSLQTSESFFNYDDAFAPYRYDTVMTLYELKNDSVSYGNLSQVACNDDVAVDVRYSRINFTPVPGRWYYIRVTPFKANAIPAGSQFVLTAYVSDLLDDTSWTFKGKGKSDDVMNCNNHCYFNFLHTVKGASKVVQTIDTFKGVRLQPGAALMLSASAYYNGSKQNHVLKVVVTYTDGTKHVRKAKEYIPPNRTSGSLVFESYTLTIEKPVKSVKVMFVEKTKGLTDSFISVSDIRLLVFPNSMASRDGGALPLPDAPAEPKL